MICFIKIGINIPSHQDIEKPAMYLINGRKKIMNRIFRTKVIATIISIVIMGLLAFPVNAHATIAGESMERQFRESMLRQNTHLRPEDIKCCGYFDANGNEVTRDEFANLLAQSALEGASPEYRATHMVDSEGRIVNIATGLPDPVDAKGRPVSSTAVKQPAKEKVTAKFVNLYGVIIDTSKITKGTDIARSQFPKDNPPDIVTSTGIMTFDGWDYDGKVLENDITVKALYKKQ